jgi:hypothetical protein
MACMEVHALPTDYHRHQRPASRKGAPVVAVVVGVEQAVGPERLIQHLEPLECSAPTQTIDSVRSGSKADSGQPGVHR